jgi:2-polyprenyl-3-methyl-5-hydroxy-6-metoxy-1,4-benzoquinol methylase
MNKGWFKIPGVRDGDRTLKEQMIGLEPALAEAKGKTVLDLGCAEGLIAREFARAGAKQVVGIELLAAHLAVAKAQCRGLDNISFICAHLGDYIVTLESIPQYDIVLALGIIHKLHDPAVPLRFAAQSAKSLVLFRAPAKKYDGLIKSKHTDLKVDVPELMQAEGFAEEQLIPGVRGEAVQYWRRR